MNRTPACTSLIRLYLWQAQVSLECMSAAFSALQKMVAGDWFSYGPSNALGLRNFNQGVEMSKQFARKILREVPTGQYWQVLFPDGAHEEYFGKSHDGKTAEQQADEAVVAYNEWAKNQLKIRGYSE